MDEKFKILLADSVNEEITTICDILQETYDVVVDSDMSVDVLKDNKFQIIIAHEVGNAEAGIDFLKKTLELSPESVRVFITDCSDSALLIRAINEAKIYRYIKSPYSPTELKLVLKSIKEYLLLKKENDKLLLDLKKLFTGTVSAITDALDGKNPYIFGKSRRVAFCAIKLAEYIGLSDEEVGKIDIAGLLHDIGMVGIPEKVLNKAGILSPEEKMITKQHVENGIKILEDIKQLKDILEIIKYHHEQYDGNGYPFGLKGEEIPIASRIIAVADAYDGLISNRSYRKGFSHEDAIKKLKERAGTGLDPKLVDAFVKVMDKSLDEFRAFEEELTKL